MPSWLWEAAGGAAFVVLFLAALWWQLRKDKQKEAGAVGNRVAPRGYVYVCGGCGKRSRDQYGEQALDYGWDESCMLNCSLQREDKLILRVRDIKK